MIVAVVSAVTIIAFACFIYLRAREERTVIDEANNLVGQSFSLNHFMEAGSNKDYVFEIGKNESVMIVYLLKGCEACESELQAIAKTNLDKNIKIFGIMFDNEESVTDYIMENHINFPVLLDKDGTLLKDNGLIYFPTNLKVKNGVIERALFGSFQDKEQLLEFAK